MRSHRCLAATLVPFVLTLSACTVGPGGAGPQPADQGRSPSPQQEYRFVGFAVGPTDGDEVDLCAPAWIGIAEAAAGSDQLPCDPAATATGWDWSGLDARSAAGTSSGLVDVVGTWDAETRTLAVTRAPTTPDRVPPVAPSPYETEPDFSTLCEAPGTGWESLAPTDPARADFHGGYEASSTADGFVAAWVSRNPGTARPTWVVLNVLTAGDVTAVETAVRARWSGPLCVRGGARNSAADLEAVAVALDATPGVFDALALDLQQKVFAQAWVVPAGLEDELAAQHGEGTVELRAILEPLP